MDNPTENWVREEEEGVNGAAFKANLAPISAPALFV